ncbi:MAG: autotransporter outer membrane beta-barrel domain-containing protein [Deltaproteobacteria bacterium]|nr:autotransporter outer membrane beta-barrel domain-containing protein [Deltaproteobacteria bacterium]
MKRLRCRTNQLVIIVAGCLALTFTAPTGMARAAVLPVETGAGSGEQASAQPDSPPEETAPKRTPPWAETGIDIGFHLRRDALDWNIAGQKDGTNPNVLSELTWDDLVVYELSLGFSTLIKKRIRFKGYLNYGRIVDGENQDSDYQADDRREEFSRSNNDAGDGSTFDVSLGAGYALQLGTEVITFIPMAGLSLHRQNLTMTDGYQTITWDQGPSLGPFSGLDSSYEAQWWGPWIGLDVTLDIDTGWKALPQVFPHAGVEYHWAEYYAQADWNLRDDFEHPKSFEHDARGTGVRMMVGIGTQFNENWSMEFGYAQQRWSATDGIDRVFFSDGTRAETRLNEVNWKSHSLSIAVRYRF